MENILLDEYKEAGANMRHYGTHALTFLSFFLAFTGGLLSVLLGANPPKCPEALNVFGLVVTLLFWVMIETCHFFWGHLLRRAAAIESQLGFGQYSSLPDSQIFREIRRPVVWATRLLFSFGMGYWIYVIFGIVMSFVVSPFCLVVVIVGMHLFEKCRIIHEETINRREMQSTPSRASASRST